MLNEIQVQMSFIVMIVCYNRSRSNVIHCSQTHSKFTFNDMFCLNENFAEYLISICYPACINRWRQRKQYHLEGFSQQPSPKYYISNDFPYHLFTQDSIKWEVIFLNFSMTFLSKYPNKKCKSRKLFWKILYFMYLCIFITLYVVAFPLI